MPTVQVKHNRLGEGTLIRKLNGGFLWEVRFPSGHAYRLPFKEFESTAAQISTNGVSDQFRTRQALEALRMGIVPLENVRDLTIGLETERVSLQRALARSQEEGGDVMAVIADYGFGKSHFIELTAQNALEKNFIVASASLDLVEAPPGKAREIYKALVHTIQYPDTDEQGLAPLMRAAVENPAVLQQFVERKPIEDCPLSVALLALADCRSQTAYDDIIAWISGAVTTPSADARAYLSKPPKLYLNGEVARQYTYLLSAISVLAKMLGLSGLAVLIDESEHYSLLRAAQRGKADSFFKSLIYAAVGENNRRIDISTIPNHTRANYPITFASPSNLFFVFASTESENRMPIESWLAPSQQVRLDDRFLKDDILKFAKMVLRYHSVAYNYAPSADRYKSLLENVSVLLSRTLSQHRINLRQLIQLMVTICDLMFLHRDYDEKVLLQELGSGLGM
ncbi:MAG: BREX system ATP-binding domain-containing protein [Chloroflexota bacterium]